MHRGLAKLHQMISSNIKNPESVPFPSSIDSEILLYNIDNEIIDGSYLMTIEIPPMVLDAAPSRPFIFDIKD